jgi:GcrA cell cycle regulator
MTTATWTPERIERLRSCVDTGLTCSQIAAEIGVTRNAVIGKIHRLGLAPGRPAATPARSCPPSPRRPRFSPQQKLLRLMFAQAPCIDEGTDSSLIDSTQRCTLLELAQGKCRWPINDAVRDSSAANFVFCGNEAIAGFSYCAGHSRMAYRIPARRRA